MEDDIKAVAQNKAQLAEAYNVGMKTFKKWIEPFKDELGEYRGKAYTPKQVQIIYEHLGTP